MVLLFGVAEAAAFDPIAITNRPSDPNSVELHWHAKTGKTYSIQQSTDLSSGFTPWATGLGGRNNLNTFRIGTDATPARFFVLREEDPQLDQVELVDNGTLNDFSGWARSVNAAATAVVDAVNGELVANITVGGDQNWHVQALHPGLNLESNKNYTFSFDAQSVGGDRSIAFRLQSLPPGTQTNYLESSASLTTVSKRFRFNFTMTNSTDTNARINFRLGASDHSVHIDNISLGEGIPIVKRAAAHRFLRRMRGGANFAAYMAVPGHGAKDDYELLDENSFSHCRIGYKLDEENAAGPGFEIPESHLAELQRLVDLCLGEGLIAVIDPVHDWMASGFDPATDMPELTAIWQQVAVRFANYPLDMVCFEIANEPRSDDNVTAIISNALTAIRAVSGNEQRIVIVPGDGFSTRQALIDAFDHDEIPATDNYLIGTFHYYDPFAFTKQGDGTNQIAWGTTAEYDQVGADFDAVVAAGHNFALRHSTEPLPIYLGEFGVDNLAATVHRKAWNSWVRLQAEKRGFSWCYWLLYNDQNHSKGIGPWDAAVRTDPSQRSLQPEQVEALHTFHQFEDGPTVGAVTVSTNQSGFTGTGHVSFPPASVLNNRCEINTYAAKDDTYLAIVRYSSANQTTLKVNVLDDAGTVHHSQIADFPATGANNWSVLKLPVNLAAGEEARIRFVSQGGEGPHLDFLKLTQSSTP